MDGKETAEPKRQNQNVLENLQLQSTTKSVESENLDFSAAEGTETINSIFGPNGLIAKYSESENDESTSVAVLSSKRSSKGDDSRVEKEAENSKADKKQKLIPVLPSNSGPDAERESEADLIQKMLGIEMIVETIISHMNIEQLKTARLVSRHWAAVASKELQKKLRITFSYKFFQSDDMFEYFCHFRNEKGQTLRALNQLLEEKAIVNANFGCAFEFPCISFEFAIALLKNNVFQKFLKLYGNHIEELRLWLNYGGQDSYEYSTLGHLQTLLVDQVPFLKCIGFGLALMSEEVEELTKNLPFLMHNKSLDNNAVYDLPNLSKLLMWDNVLLPIFEGIYESAKNLREVQFDTENVHYLLKPKNRVELVKEFVFYYMGHTRDDPEILEMLVASSQSGRLSLRKLEFYFDIPLTSSKNWGMIKEAINTILKASSSSLKMFLCSEDPFLYGIEVPSDMGPMTWSESELSYVSIRSPKRVN